MGSVWLRLSLSPSPSWPLPGQTFPCLRRKESEGVISSSLELQVLLTEWKVHLGLRTGVTLNVCVALSLRWQFSRPYKSKHDLSPITSRGFFHLLGVLSQPPRPRKSLSGLQRPKGQRVASRHRIRSANSVSGILKSRARPSARARREPLLGRETPRPSLLPTLRAPSPAQPRAPPTLLPTPQIPRVTRRSPQRRSRWDVSQS